MKMKTEKSVYTQAGYKCSSCGVHVKVYNGAPPPNDCLNCGAMGTLKMDWNQKIESIISIEHLPIDGEAPST